MTRIIYVVYTKEYLTSRQITGANLKKYAFLCDYSEVKMMDKGGNNSMIETMLMMQMMGNNQMSFPFMPNQSQKEEK